jgi:hypothetical protein
MISKTTRQFRNLLAALPANIRKQAHSAYRLFQKNPHHPGLRFKQVHDDPVTYSARVGISHRALAVVRGHKAIWFWIGSHADYDQVLNQM